MALKLTLQGTTPGQGQIIIQGADIPAQTLEISIQRNQDEQYLAQAGLWQSTPYWHTVEDVQEQGNLLVAKIGNELIDGLVAAAGMMFFMGVRTADYQGQQVLKVAGRLLGSGAAGEIAADPAPVIPPPAMESPKEVETPVPEAEQDATQPEPVNEMLAESQIEPEPVSTDPEPTFDDERIEPVISHSGFTHDDEDDEQIEDDSEEEDARPGLFRRFWYIWLALILTLFISVGLYLWWQQPWQNKDQPVESETVSQEAGEPDPGDSSASGLTGRARVGEYLDTKPDSEHILTTAKTWEKEDDCEAVRILLNMTASTHTDIALSLAQLYDPQSGSERKCQDADLETAAYWYEQPANQGNQQAQLRLGMILTETNSSGPLYDKGIQQLKAAAAQGSKEATQQLKKLGE